MTGLLQHVASLFKKTRVSDVKGGDETRDIGDIAKNGTKSQRLSLAADNKTNREVLYYLAENDPDPDVRKTVIENDSMPLHVTPILAKDTSDDVRIQLAARLVDLLPDLSYDKHSNLYAFVVQALGTLALDEVLRIRLALSSTLKDHAYAPPKIAAQLARDIEREVAEPILRFCASLADEDLLDILSAHPGEWAIEAIAGRENVSEPVSKAVVETGHINGGRILIENKGAEINSSLLHIIVEKARTTPEWQRPAALRKGLTRDMAKELAGFVDESVKGILLSREDFDKETVEEIAAVVNRRVDFAIDTITSDRIAADQAINDRLMCMIHEGTLDEAAISDALGLRQYDFVIAALAHKCSVMPMRIQEIMDAQAPKSIVAVVWKAGLSMRLALRIQQDMGHIQPEKLVYPKDGSEYPFSDEKIKKHLSVLNICKS